MGLRDDIQADVAQSYDADLADAVTALAGERETVSDNYDPVVGGYPTSVMSYTGRGVMGGYRAAEIDGGHILATDTKLSGVLQNELIDEAGATIAPAVDDKINGMTVMDVRQDPASATYTLQLRKT